MEAITIEKTAKYNRESNSICFVNKYDENKIDAMELQERAGIKLKKDTDGLYISEPFGSFIGDCTYCDFYEDGGGITEGGRCHCPEKDTPFDCGWGFTCPHNTSKYNENWEEFEKIKKKNNNLGSMNVYDVINNYRFLGAKEPELYTEDGCCFLNLKCVLENNFEKIEVRFPKLELPLKHPTLTLEDDEVFVEFPFGKLPAHPIIDNNEECYAFIKVIEEKTVEMTMDEIEKKLGHKVKIVEKND